MYLLYEVKKVDKGHEFNKIGETKLAGNSDGIIPQCLKKVLTRGVTQPHKWHIDVAKAMRRAPYLSADAVLIELKNPKKKDVASRYQILDIDGYSNDDWTPFMLRLRDILTDERPEDYPKDKFTIDSYENQPYVYTFLYARGTIVKGQIVGSWNFPGPSSTNSVLLWPDARKYFLGRIEYYERGVKS